MIGIFGIGGCGRSIMPVARERFADDSDLKFVFVDDEIVHSNVNGHEVITLRAFAENISEMKSIGIAVADPSTRRVITKRCEDYNLEFLSLVSQKAILMDNVSIESGALISPFVTVTSNIKIGKHFHANLYSYVEHDCVIGDFVTFAPSVHCNGNVHIGDGAYIGTGAILRQGTPDKPLVIGAGAVVGMGAVVTRDVPPGVTVIGNPARIMTR